MPWKYNGKNIQIGRSWTSSDNVVHPSNWGIWSDDYKKSVGLTFEKEVDNSFDDRFYWSKGNAKSLTDKLIGLLKYEIISITTINGSKTIGTPLGTKKFN